jgi:AcrR family transcriptional regulator
VPRKKAATDSRRLSKPERREQLLETALALVRERGTDALTLAVLAEEAGVTKPIAYEHFGTRSGLLVALYQQIDDRQVELMRAAIERTPPRLAEVARVVSESYVACYREHGAEWLALSSALHGDEEMDAFQRKLFDRYVGVYRDAFAPYVRVNKRELGLRCICIVGAADAIARDMVQGRVNETSAIATLTSLIVSWLGKT